MEVSVHSVLDQTGTTTPCQRFLLRKSLQLLQTDGGKLPKNLHFVSPQRFVTSSLVQALGEIDRLLPGTELEIHTSTSKEALSLKPSLKSVRVLTLPHMEFEFCNVYRGNIWQDSSIAAKAS